jgi:hypothetical protein
LPVAVILKRFFTPLLVFSLGIFISFVEDTFDPPWQPLSPGRKLIRVCEVRAFMSACHFWQGF